MATTTTTFTKGDSVSFESGMRFQTGRITSITKGVARVAVDDGFDGTMSFKVPVGQLTAPQQW